MSADADIKDSERDVLRGALRSLSEGGLGSAATDAMLHELEERLARDGMEVRLDNVAAHLWPDPNDRELALALAAATAKADGTIDGRSNDRRRATWRRGRSLRDRSVRRE